MNEHSNIDYSMNNTSRHVPQRPKVEAFGNNNFKPTAENVSPIAESSQHRRSNSNQGLKFIPIPLHKLDTTPIAVTSFVTMKTPLSESFVGSPNQNPPQANLTPENFKTFETMMEIDGEINQSLEKQLGELQCKIDSLESQFDVAVNFSRQLEEKYKDVNLVMKGAQLAKICKGSLKTHSRLFYYNPMLEALCWKDPVKNVAGDVKVKITKLRDIKAINAGNLHHFKIRRGVKGSLAVDPECLLTIETLDSKFIDVIHPNLDSRNKWLKSLNMLISDRRSKRGLLSSFQCGAECDFFQQKLIEDITNSKIMIEDLKKKYQGGILTVRKHFVDAAKQFIKAERGKYENLTKKTKILEEKYAKWKSKRKEMQEQKTTLEEELMKVRLANNEALTQVASLKETALMNGKELATLLEHIRQSAPVYDEPRHSQMLSPSQFSPGFNYDTASAGHSNLISEITKTFNAVLLDFKSPASKEYLKQCEERDRENKVLSERFNKIMQQNSSLTVMLKETNESLNNERQQNQEFFAQIKGLQEQIIKLNLNGKEPVQAGTKKEGEQNQEYIQKIVKMTENNEVMAKFAKILGFWLIVSCNNKGIANMIPTSPKQRSSVLDYIQELNMTLQRDTKMIEDIKNTSSFDVSESVRFIENYLKANDKTNNYVVKLLDEVISLFKRPLPPRTSASIAPRFIEKENLSHMNNNSSIHNNSSVHNNSNFHNNSLMMMLKDPKPPLAQAPLDPTAAAKPYTSTTKKSHHAHKTSEVKLVNHLNQ